MLEEKYFIFILSLTSQQICKFGFRFYLLIVKYNQYYPKNVFIYKKPFNPSAAHQSEQAVSLQVVPDSFCIVLVFQGVLGGEVYGGCDAGGQIC